MVAAVAASGAAPDSPLPEAEPEGCAKTVSLVGATAAPTLKVLGAFKPIVADAACNAAYHTGMLLLAYHKVMMEVQLLTDASAVTIQSAGCQFM